MTPDRATASNLVAGATIIVSIAVGLVVGRATGADYTERDLESAVAHAKTQARIDSEAATQGVRQQAAADVEAAQGDAEGFEAEIRRLERVVGRRDRTIGRLNAEVRSLRSDIRALDKPRDIDQGQSTPPAADPELTVSGTLKSSWVLTSQLKPWPPDCGGAQKSYQVRVENGSGATVAIANITLGRVASRNEKQGILTLTCLLTYETALPQPLSAVYEFVAVSKGDPNATLKAALVPVASLRGGHGPELYVSFCPEC